MRCAETLRSGDWEPPAPHIATPSHRHNTHTPNMRATISRASAVQRMATLSGSAAQPAATTMRRATAAATAATAAPQHRLFSLYTAAAAHNHTTSLRKCACSACNNSSAAYLRLSYSSSSSSSAAAPAAAVVGAARSFATQTTPKNPAAGATPTAASTTRAATPPSSFHQPLAPAQVRTPSFNAIMKVAPHNQPHATHREATRDAEIERAHVSVVRGATLTPFVFRPALCGCPPCLFLSLQRFNLLVHPDLFGSTPTHAHANQVSLQQLNSLLSTLKTRDSKESYPPKQVLQLVFHVKKRRGDEKWAEYVRTHDLRMHLAGKCAPAQASAAGPNNHGARRRPAPRAPPRGVSALPPRGTHVLENEFHVVPVIVSTNGGHCKNQVQEQLSSLFYRCGLPHKFEWDDEYWNMGGARYREAKEEELQEEEEGEDRK